MSMRRKLTWACLAAFTGAIAYVGSVRATPSAGFTGSTLAKGRFDEISTNNFVIPASVWQARMKTQGLSDLYVQTNVWEPGGTTGWHTHPGASLIIVTAGAVTAYESDDPSCSPQVYTEGMGFVDPGGGHVHVIRNEGGIEARTVAVQLIPAGATRRIDAPAPPNCPF